MTLSVSSEEEAVEEDREGGTEFVPEHLRGHLAQNPRSSYVTWIATLHPKNESVEIDPHFLLPGDPWAAVYEDTKFYNTGGGPPPPPPPPPQPVDGGVSVIQEQQTRNYSGFLDLTVGMAIAVSGALSAFAIEASALIIHYLADLFEAMTSRSSQYTWTKYSFGLLWRLLWHVLTSVAYILLFVSVMLTEILAVVSFLLCALLGMSVEAGLAAHQRTRRLSHFTRWACRLSFGTNVHPPNSTQQPTMPEATDENNPKTIAVPTAAAVTTSDNIPTATVIGIDNESSDNDLELLASDKG